MTFRLKPLVARVPTFPSRHKAPVIGQIARSTRGLSNRSLMLTAKQNMASRRDHESAVPIRFWQLTAPRRHAVSTSCSVRFRSAPPTLLNIPFANPRHDYAGRILPVARNSVFRRRLVGGQLPTTVTSTVLWRPRTSHSRWKICCQVPRTNLPPAMGTVREGPSNVACKWEWPLPSCQACS